MFSHLLKSAVQPFEANTWCSSLFSNKGEISNSCQTQTMVFAYLKWAADQLKQRSHKVNSPYSLSTCDKHCHCKFLVADSNARTYTHTHTQHTHTHTHTNVHTSAALHHGFCALSNNIRSQGGLSGIIRITHPLHSSLCVSSSLTGSASSLTPPILPPLTNTHNPNQSYKWHAFLGKLCSPLVMIWGKNLIVWTSIMYFFSPN